MDRRIQPVPFQCVPAFALRFLREGGELEQPHSILNRLLRSRSNGRETGHAGRMSLMHCPLCVGLAVLSVARALAHLSMGWWLGWGRVAPAPTRRQALLPSA